MVPPVVPLTPCFACPGAPNISQLMFRARVRARERGPWLCDGFLDSSPTAGPRRPSVLGAPAQLSDGYPSIRRLSDAYPTVVWAPGAHEGPVSDGPLGGQTSVWMGGFPYQNRLQEKVESGERSHETRYPPNNTNTDP